MSRPIARYRPSRRYAAFASLAFLAAVPSAWMSETWGWAWTAAAVLFTLTAALMLLLALRPVIEIHETHLRIGKRIFFWNEIQQLDRVSIFDQPTWPAPLLLRMTLPRGQEVMIFHPGDADSCISLLRHIYRNSHTALLDGSPYQEFWGAPAPVQAPPRPRLLLAEDEEDVERMFQRLRATGRLEEGDGIDHHGAGHHTGSDES